MGTWYKMLGPSIIVAGLALIWAGIVGATTQFFINMEVERYALLRGLQYAHHQSDA
jgi:hypothetical protein